MDEATARRTPHTRTEPLDPAALGALARTAGEAHEAALREHELAVAALREQLGRYQAIIENITAGVCFFDREKRLLLSNRRYAEIYRVPPEAIRPGMTLAEVVELRLDAGQAAMSADEYEKLTDAINAGTAPREWLSTLADGRIIQVRQTPSVDGGC